MKTILFDIDLFWYDQKHEKLANKISPVYASENPDQGLDLLKRRRRRTGIVVVCADRINFIMWIPVPV